MISLLALTLGITVLRALHGKSTRIGCVVWGMLGLLLLGAVAALTNAAFIDGVLREGEPLALFVAIAQSQLPPPRKRWLLGLLPGPSPEVLSSISPSSRDS